MSVTLIKLATGQVAVVSDYHPDWVERARALGGQWMAVERKDGSTVRAWAFPAAARENVRAALRAVYGEDGTQPAARVSVRVSREALPRGGDSWYVCGREIAHRAHRDRPVTVYAGVAVVRGEFDASGGSMRYPSVTASDDLVLEIEDVPLALAEQARAEHPDAVEILPHNPPDIANAVEAAREVARLRAELAAAEARFAALPAEVREAPEVLAALQPAEE